VIDIVSQHRLGLVEEHSRLFRTPASVDNFLQQIGIVTARGFDEKLLGGSTLKTSVSCVFPSQGEKWFCSWITAMEGLNEKGGR
jgi:hypothetical protein